MFNTKSMSNIEILKNSGYTHNFEYMNNLTNIEKIHPYFNNTQNIQNTNLNYFKNILKTQKLNNFKKNKLQEIFLL